jgi:hypothetical protein
VKLNFLTKYKIFNQYLYQNLGYFAQKCYELSGDKFTVTEAIKPILIVARQHYSEQWQTYSSLSLKELKSILDFQRKSATDIRVVQQYIVNKEQDGFDVKVIEFNEKFIKSIPLNTLLIPETELINNQIDERSVCQLVTPIGELFWAKSTDKVHSVYRQGLLNSPDAFKMSIGYPAETKVAVFEQEQYLNLLKNSLLHINILQLLKISSFEFTQQFDVKALHKVYWAPLITGLVFLLSTNGYFLYKQDMLERQLLSYGDQVTELLQAKVKQDENTIFIDAINKEVHSIPLVHDNWAIVYQAIKSNMHVQRFAKQDDGYVLRGLADDASKVLTTINNLPQVSSAGFQGVVRKSRKKDSFIIKLELTPLPMSNTIKES